MKNEIIRALASVEQQHNCKVLFACESGSRAWGFSSKDSDYDVRFIYCHPKESYFKIGSTVDTINEMLPHDIDLSGWELKKSFLLFSECNLSLFEWIGSPAIYLSQEHFHSTLKDLRSKYFNPKRGLYHYLSMAKKIKEKHLISTDVNIKKIFYIIRPLLACQWIIRYQTMPPTEFFKLLTPEFISENIRKQLDELLKIKSKSSEKDTTQISKTMIEWIETMESIALNASNNIQPKKNTNYVPLNQLIIDSLDNVVW